MTVLQSRRLSYHAYIVAASCSSVWVRSKVCQERHQKINMLCRYWCHDKVNAVDSIVGLSNELSCKHMEQLRHVGEKKKKNHQGLKQETRAQAISDDEVRLALRLPYIYCTWCHGH